MYWLTVGGEPGQRLVEKNAAPTQAAPPGWFRTTLHLERDRLYHPLLGGPDYWVWNFWPVEGRSFHYTAEVRGVAAGPLLATLRARVKGATADAAVNPDHHLRLSLNGHFLQDVFWDDQTEPWIEVSFPQSWLVEGGNEIRVEAPQDTGASLDTGLVNWFEIEYARQFVAVENQLQFSFTSPGAQPFRIHGLTTDDPVIFDITEPKAPKQLVNAAVAGSGPFEVTFQDTLEGERVYLVAAQATFLRPVQIEPDAPSSWRSPANGADYIVITNADFYHQVWPLAAARAAQGLRTVVIDVQDIYDEFADGVFTPEAIRDFLAYAYAHWQPPAPSYVLLVGDGHFDFKNNLATGERNFIPPLLAPVGVRQIIIETASDNRYVTISGDDNVPDLFIGRLPVNTPAEARAVVQKILNYEQGDSEEAGQRRVMFVADNADNAGDFRSLCDSVADEHLPSSFEREKIYLRITHASPAGATAAILAGFNDGRLLVNYAGHSGIPLWASESLLVVYRDRDDLAALSHTDHLPMVVSFSSLDTAFHWTGLPALGESFVRAEGKGAIAWWGSSGGGVLVGHYPLNIGFFDAVFGRGITQIGPAMLVAKLALYDVADVIRNHLDLFTLLGDPAVTLAVPKP